MQLTRALRAPRYALLAAAAALALFWLYAYSQVLFIWQNLDLWLAIAPRVNLGLFIAFSALFGITLSYQAWLRAQPKACSLKAGPQAAGTLLSFLVVQCPACASIGVLFLPLSVVTFFTAFSTWLNLLAIALLLFTLLRLGAFTAGGPATPLRKKRT
ncbi:MAG: hypothetical protein HY520_02365 [Candidatus Aenigmarchaeota archaeon]|nr:hypothetical protein [Candidatus Aenigmarchaeota archaeon]